MKVLLVAGADDARRRYRFVSDPLESAGVEFDVVTTVEAEQSDPDDVRPSVVVLFHGGARTLQRIRRLKNRFGVPVLLRIGGRNDLTGIDLMSGCLRQGRVAEAARSLANSVLDSRSLAAADGTICVSQGLANWVADRFGHPVVVAPPVRAEFDCGDAEFDSMVLQGSRSKCVLTTANLKYRAKARGVARLIPTFELVRDRCPEVQWKILGDGPWMGFLERRVRRSRHAEAIELAGWSNDVRSAMCGATQFWYSSRLDAYPLVVSESMWSGRPALVEAGTPAAEMIPPGGAIEVGSQWVAASLQLLGDDERYRFVAEGQRALARSRESPVSVGQRLREWLSSNFL